MKDTDRSIFVFIGIGIGGEQGGEDPAGVRGRELEKMEEDVLENRVVLRRRRG